MKWGFFLPNIGFGWEPRALAPDPTSLLLKVQIERKTIVIGKTIDAREKGPYSLFPSIDFFPDYAFFSHLNF